MTARPLVIGAAGQVGKALTTALGPTALKAGRKPEQDGWLQIDLAALAHNPEAAAAALAPLNLSAIYCVGGATDVERCETDPTWAMDTNCHGPIALAQASGSIPFVFFSTDYVFDGASGPYDETAPTNPISVYGRSKLLGEQGVLAARPDALILRTTGVYGPDVQQKNFLYTLRRLLSSGQTMRVPSDQISTPTYNEDLAHAAIALVAAHHSGIFNVAGPDLLSRYDFALQAAALLGLDTTNLHAIPTSALNQKAPRPLASGLLIDKLRSTLPHLHIHTTTEAIEAWKTHEAPQK
ncbi:MAG: SDR family oxidoreductase [Acidobacteriota bacterium]